MAKRKDFDPPEQPKLANIKVKLSFKPTIVECVVTFAVAWLLGVIVLDEVQAQVARKRGVSQAGRDVAGGEFSFRIGGTPYAWFDETAEVFRQQYGAKLIRSYGCCPSSYDANYDFAYNDAVAAALTRRSPGFSFPEAYAAAEQIARVQHFVDLAAK
jgi:hypothetical protein